MIPGPWAALVVALGVFRVVRLCGWDDFPPVLRLRRRLTGETVYRTPTESRDSAIYRYDRPTLNHFLNCAFCQGFWWATVAYVAWRLEPRWTLVVLAPFALSAAVGLIAKNLDE